MLLILIFTSLPILSLALSQGFSWVALYDREILFVTLSIFTILNFIFCETERTLLGVIFLLAQYNS